MEIRFLKAAQLELDESFIYYEEQIAGLGFEFIHEIKNAIKQIKVHSEAWAEYSNRTRRYLVKKFPFGVIYQIRENEILIVAIAHSHRKPMYWKERIEQSE
jgi:hypothetical protein